MTLVVDASVVVKWVLQEDKSDAALALYLDDRLIAPSLLYAEIGNALWKAVTVRGVSLSDAQIALSAATAPLDDVISSDELSARALELAVALKHPIYDCFYLALSERENAPLVTADQRLLKAAKRVNGIQVRAL